MHYPLQHDKMPAKGRCSIRALSLFSAALLNASFAGRRGRGNDSKEREAAAQVAGRGRGGGGGGEVGAGAMMRCGGERAVERLGNEQRSCLSDRVVGRVVMCVQWAWPIQQFTGRV
jgi:hypothetical protein